MTKRHKQMEIEGEERRGEERRGEERREQEKRKGGSFVMNKFTLTYGRQDQKNVVNSFKATFPFASSSRIHQFIFFADTCFEKV